jgi:hypothetical protein
MQTALSTRQQQGSPAEVQGELQLHTARIRALKRQFAASPPQGRQQMLSKLNDALEAGREVAKAPHNSERGRRVAMKALQCAAKEGTGTGTGLLYRGWFAGE